jgi:hypothetical protein
MPTVLDYLREHLLGEEVADRLGQWLATMAAVYPVEPAAAAKSTKPELPPLSTAVSGEPSREPAGFLGVILGMGLRKGKVIEYLDELPPSAGYEPFFVDAGRNRVAACGAAALAVQHGRRRAKEAKQHRPVFDAIRFLGKQKRQRRAILRCAKTLLKARQETSIIETIFDDAGQSEIELMGLLQAVCDGRGVDRQRITDIAAAVAPHISLRRGPKITAWSAAHEFLFGQDLELRLKRGPYLGRMRAEQYVEPRTEATCKEFGLANFDSRPARRRIKRIRSGTKI